MNSSPEPLNPAVQGGLTVVFSEVVLNALPSELHYTPNGFTEDTGTHLTGAQLSVDEYDRYFLDFESHFVCGELHLNLEGIAFESDGI